LQQRDQRHEGDDMPWAYLVECRDGSFYVGSTYDLERRLSEHNEGLGAKTPGGAAP
jgi:predicted GIY-YIG superfamily endonuclease